LKLLLFRHLWGVDETWELVFPKIQNEGYHGIEAPLPNPEQRGRFKDLLKQFGFSFIPQIFTSGKTVDAHITSFEKQVDEAQSLQPQLINCHSGFDGWPEEESVRFFEKAMQIESARNAAVAHETHRGRILFHPWITARLLSRFENLKLCCDFSHWVCVCERLIDDQAAIIAQCAPRTIHIHARVGYEEGPQVPDPRAPEYRRHLEAHERWWEAIWSAQKQRGMKESTLTPEFGPPPYLHTLAHTEAPVANLWDICNWQAKRQAERFAAFDDKK